MSYQLQLQHIKVSFKWFMLSLHIKLYIYISSEQTCIYILYKLLYVFVHFVRSLIWTNKMCSSVLRHMFGGNQRRYHQSQNDPQLHWELRFGIMATLDRLKQNIVSISNTSSVSRYSPILFCEPGRQPEDTARAKPPRGDHVMAWLDFNNSERFHLFNLRPP